MTEKTKEVLATLKHKRVGLYIDNANWFYPQQELGWRISFTALRDFLQDNVKTRLYEKTVYAGTPTDPQHLGAFTRFKDTIWHAGYDVTTKPLKKIWLDPKRKKFIYKCNFDVEMALDIAEDIDSLDVVMVGSGDSDFVQIQRFAKERKKGFIALCFEKGVAWEIRKLHHIFLEDIKRYIVKQ